MRALLCRYGWSPQGKTAAMLRGPMASGLITQLACGTDWGELDVRTNLVVFDASLHAA